MGGEGGKGRTRLCTGTKGLLAIEASSSTVGKTVENCLR